MGINIVIDGLFTARSINLVSYVPETLLEPAYLNQLGERAFYGVRHQPLVI